MVDVSAKDVVAALRARGWMLVTAESCTGGLISSAITEVAGASAVFDSGFVTYSNAAKAQMLGIAPHLIDSHGAVSEQVAREMAKGALDHSAGDIAVSVTGIAGPGGSDFKPEGRVCFGCATKDGKTHVETVDFGAVGRSLVRAQTVAHALELVSQICGQGLPLK